MPKHQTSRPFPIPHQPTPVPQPTPQRGNPALPLQVGPGK